MCSDRVFFESIDVYFYYLNSIKRPFNKCNKELYIIRKGLA